MRDPSRTPRQNASLWRTARRALPCAALLLLFASGARGQTTAPAVRLYVLADTVALGEAFEVAVAADHAPGVQVLFPEVPREQSLETGPLLTFGDIEATEMRRLAPVATGETRTDSAVYRVLAFAADSARVGPLAVRFASGGDTTAVESGVGEVRIHRLVQGADAEPEPPADPFPFPSPAPVWTLLGVIALAVAALAGWGLWRFARRPARQRPTPRPLPYPEVTSRLDALAENLPAPEASQAWFVALSDATRTYLERRLGIPAMEQTTRETDEDIASRVPEEARSALRGALRAADHVKFADLRPGAEASGDALARARDGIDAIEAHLAAQEEAARAAAEAEKKATASRTNPKAPA